MRCDWDGLLSVLPPRIRSQLGQEEADSGQELRLRIGQPCETVCREGSRFLEGMVRSDELEYLRGAVTRFSPWTAQTLGQGYATAPGGHRVGFCGEAVCREGEMEGIRGLSSACVRIARDFPGAASGLENLPGSILILGPPGWGKTTLLRDLIRQKGKSCQAAVVDEREELFPRGFDRGSRTDVLTGCPKAQGVLTLLRTMSPEYLAVDEITHPQDSQALLCAAHCGVQLLATAHAASGKELARRPAYRALVEGRCFDWFVILHKDKTYHLERNVA